MFYQKIIRPILFLSKPEDSHDGISRLGERVAKIPVIGDFFRSQTFVTDPSLEVTYKGIEFPNPIGLSAGYDKNGTTTNFNEMMGFGFMIIGSITDLPYQGNLMPQLRRLVKNESIIVNYGLKSDGAEKVYNRLKSKTFRIPVGISVAKSNLPEVTGDKAVQDYVNVFEKFVDVGDYYTINISCPNTYDGTPFTDSEKLDKLLSKLSDSRDKLNITKPIFLKINPELPHDVLDNIIELVQKYNIDGMVIGNLLKDKKRAIQELSHPKEYNSEWPGSMSGKPLKSVSTECIRYVYRKTNGSLFIIGCGGVSTGEDAYEKIKAGASLIQMITGLIYNGPLTVKRINKRLIELLKSDGYSSISEAVGQELK